MPILLSRLLRAIPIARSHLASRSSFPGLFGRFTVTLPPSTPSAQRRESSRNVAAGNFASAMPNSNAWSADSIRFCLSGFSMMTFRAFSIPMRFGSR